MQGRVPHITSRKERPRPSAPVLCLVASGSSRQEILGNRVNKDSHSLIRTPDVLVAIRLGFPDQESLANWHLWFPLAMAMTSILDLWPLSSSRSQGRGSFALWARKHCLGIARLSVVAAVRVQMELQGARIQ